MKESSSSSQMEKSSNHLQLKDYRNPISHDVELPQDMITEILLHLPVKPLLKFRCVSKSWLSLISSPRFIMSHFSISSTDKESLGRDRKLLFRTTLGRPAIKQCSLYHVLREEAEPFTNVLDLEYPTKSTTSYQIPRIVGIINGLVCLAFSGTNLYLWNPVLRKSRSLPSCSNDSGVYVKSPFDKISHSFGYDESNDDYKVVSLQIVGGGESVMVKVYSRKADSWKRIEGLKGFHPRDDPGVYANGKIYWYGYEHGASKAKIVRLDLVSDMYGEVELPDCESPHYYVRKLGLLGEQPYVLCYYYCDRKVDLWVMDHTYEVQERWYKLFSIPDPADSRMRSFPDQRAFCILIDDEIVLVSMVGLSVYNSKRKEYRWIELTRSLLYDVGSYVESLVSPI